MKTLLIAVTCMLFAMTGSVSLAGGGKNQIQNPIFGDDCVETTAPPGIDPSACEEMPAPAQSGVQVFFCDTTTVIICPDEEKVADEAE